MSATRINQLGQHGAQERAATNHLRAQRLDAVAKLAVTRHDDHGLGLAEAAGHATNPCDQAYLWGSIGWIQLRLRELDWPGAPDPLIALQRAQELHSKGCPNPYVLTLANV